MRFLKYFLGIVLILLISAIYAITNPIIYYKKDHSTSILVNDTTLYKHVKYFSSNIYRNYDNHTELDTIADYITSVLNTEDITNTEQPYQVESRTFKNILCSFGPKEGERIIIGAHYDVCGDLPGADDNASGVAGLLELARLLKENESNLKTGVDLVFYTLEEPPIFRTENMGSAVHAKSLVDKGTKVKMMISIEMIGYFSDAPNSQDFPMNALKLFYPDEGNFILIVGKLGQGGIVRHTKKYMQENCSVDVRSINALEAIPGVDFSDHLNYWKYGFKAMMITDTAFLRNKNYHTKDDTIEKLDFKKMAEVVKGIYSVILNS